MPSFEKELAAVTKWLVARQGISHKEVGDHIHMTRQHVNNILNGHRNITINFLRQIKDITKTDPWDAWVVAEMVCAAVNFDGSLAKCKPQFNINANQHTLYLEYLSEREREPTKPISYYNDKIITLRNQGMTPLAIARNIGYSGNKVYYQLQKLEDQGLL